MRAILNHHTLAQYKALGFILTYKKQYLGKNTMNNNLQNLTNSIANITAINNQTAIIVASTFSSAESSITSLGGAIGTIQTTEDLNKLLNEATNHSYQNIQLQTPYFQGLEQAQNKKIQSICSIPSLPKISQPSLCQIGTLQNKLIQNRTAPQDQLQQASKILFKTYAKKKAKTLIQSLPIIIKIYQLSPVPKQIRLFKI